jgi:hypothetical protein
MLFTSLTFGNPGDVLQVSSIDVGQGDSTWLSVSYSARTLIAVGRGKHVFTFPNYLTEPGQVCWVYTNEYHPEWCGFSYGSGSAIWNNSGDCAELRDSYGDTVDTYCY